MISACTLMNRPKAITPDMKGVTTQLATMGPMAPQWTASAEMPTAAKPITAPTMEWVVETGQPRIEAINSQVPAASNEDIMPRIKRSGGISSASTMQFLMVSVTCPPARKAQKNWKTIAIRMACLMVSAREPTDVPMALATSLAPTSQAMKKPNAQASTRSTKPYSETKDI